MEARVQYKYRLRAAQESDLVGGTILVVGIDGTAVDFVGTSGIGVKNRHRGRHLDDG